ncbi:MAG TPA: AI-2E family transporter [Opitutaceae bacterium]|nr:AI-2E family transporter [Opitutaceae bacterium]
MSTARAVRSSWPPLPHFAGYVAAACAIVALFAICWELRSVLLLAFGSIVLAIVIRTLALPLNGRFGLGERAAVFIAVLLLALLATGTFYLFGQQLTSQTAGLAERLPQAAASVRDSLEATTAGRWVLDKLAGLEGENSWLENSWKFFAVTTGTVAHTLLMIFAAIYFAATPRPYLDGFIHLFPIPQRARLRAAMLDAGVALRKWLLGQAISMASVGLLTGIGLALVRAPLPLVLGILAGLLEFIPIAGPVLAFVPGVLVALTEGPETALYAAAVYLIVQQIEGNVIMPLAQRWAVELPPAFGLIALVAFGILFGALGILFGSPLAVVLMCLVQKLYVEHGLENGRKPAAGR